MARKTWLAGIAIGAGAALGARELVVRLRNRNRRSHYWGDGPELEPEDSRSESHFPNAREDAPGTSAISGNWVRAAVNARRPRESRDGEWARQAAEPASKDPTPSRTRNKSSAPEQNASTGRTVTPTESELRRSPLAPAGPVGEAGSPTEPGTVSYTTNPNTQPAQGGEAPFIQKENS